MVKVYWKTPLLESGGGAGKFSDAFNFKTVLVFQFCYKVIQLKAFKI
jgi:hypothetical protein